MYFWILIASVVCRIADLECYSTRFLFTYREDIICMNTIKSITPSFDSISSTWISKYLSSHNPLHVTDFDFTLWQIVAVYPPLATPQIEVATEYCNRSDLSRSSKFSPPSKIRIRPSQGNNLPLLPGVCGKNFTLLCPDEDLIEEYMNWNTYNKSRKGNQWFAVRCFGPYV